MEILLIGGLHATIVVVFVWARLWYFQSSKRASILTALSYDPIVALHVFYTWYCFTQITSISTAKTVISLIVLVSSIGLFLWTIKSSNGGKLAFETTVEHIYTQGAYAIVRHPFYASYILCWSIGNFLFNSLILHITLLYLVGFYFVSARREEEYLLKSSHSDEYRKYFIEVGMFFPRISKWIN